MGALDLTQVTKLLNATLAIASAEATTSINLRLGTSGGTVPTGTADMTELSGSGYTAGGTTIAWTTATGDSGETSNSGTASWTNGSGSTWDIGYLELWDNAGSPLRWWYGAWTGEPIDVANGDTFAVAAAAIEVSMA